MGGKSLSQNLHGRTEAALAAREEMRAEARARVWARAEGGQAGPAGGGVREEGFDGQGGGAKQTPPVVREVREQYWGGKCAC
jgi:hypothetical protein